MLRTAHMNCSEVRGLLPDYLNAVVNVTTAQHMRWHIGHCKNCRIIARSAMDTIRENFCENRVMVPSKRLSAA